MGEQKDSWREFGESLASKPTDGRKEAVYSAFRDHPYFVGVEPSIARIMSDEILGEIVRKGAAVAGATEEQFTPEHWKAALKIYSNRLMAKKFVFDTLSHPAAGTAQSSGELDALSYVPFARIAG